MTRTGDDVEIDGEATTSIAEGGAWVLAWPPVRPL